MTDTPIISIRNVTKRFGSFVALEDISIDIRPGEIFALLGPSGCGKSTLLRIIAGFETPTEGDILIDGQDVTDVPPNKRPVNMVFQSYAVFPHMTVEQNVAYGLKMDRLPSSEIAPKVAEALAQVHLDKFATRMPDQLSGGQRQRVALARALVKRPRVLLLDEPLSALDAKLRDAMRLELVKLQETVGVSFVMVTHDQSEALAMADRVAVLSNGRLRQLADPMTLYQKPADAFVADFIGRVNLFDVTARNGAHVTAASIGQVPVDATALPAGEDLVVAVRPEFITLSPGAPADGSGKLKGALGDVAYQGDNSVVEVTLADGRSVQVLVTSGETAGLLGLGLGAPVSLAIDMGQVSVLRRSDL
ncbi:ABC transporter ATP-binding protein [Ovoidimarina sediminis]|uniref:ABC transporter ATP-binding protein n=1 Tax=Ovoidimarina sediminis TaxID=3079856 RepID=UPI002910650B|nr:ABC transporter ATP-binding protein [Rhodophyticola sp. MJ-SS7]MDU8943661.1 ABC transporter ATP-binding protein [Rhodophyticola sp. MJ-SS7]